MIRRPAQMTSFYHQYMRSDKWREMRIKRIRADLGMCRGWIVEKDGREHLCLSRHRLEVHHLTYARLGNEQLSDLISLCHACHKAIHNKRGKK